MRQGDIPDIDLNLLRVLHQLLAHNSVSRAACALGVTQAATSNALRRLRQHFGDELLARSGRRMVPTKRAEQLRPLVAEAAAASQRAFEIPPPFVAEKARAQVRVATSDHIDAVVLEPLIRTFAKTAPGIDLIVESFSLAATERLRNGEIDLLIAPRTNLSGEFRVARLLEEPFAVVMRRGHPYAAKKLTVKEYAGMDHILVAPGGGTKASVDAALANAGLQRRVKRFSAAFSYALLLVADTDFIATVPWSFAQRYAASLGLILKPLPVRVQPVCIDLGWARRMDRDPLNKWLRQQLITTAGKEVARLVPAQ
jgi:DNA-binding transcriptional LysR family regulator